MRIRVFGPLFALTFLAAMTLPAQAPASMAFFQESTAKFGPHPALPPCGTISVADGDPGKGPSIIMIRAKAGCTFPWHWHTANERLIIIHGSARADMKNGKPTMLHSGDFIFLPSKGIHQFHALTDVELADISDAPFDMHYVNPSGKEIPPADALKAH